MRITLIQQHGKLWRVEFDSEPAHLTPRDEPDYIGSVTIKRIFDFDKKRYIDVDELEESTLEWLESECLSEAYGS